ncbi:nucleoporin SEH1-like [Penaeus japonicus]|uniref:nucleoporin SEH1-like n=1 Tax=Penaeus japonicus TaxID=27405 RepID=UPI001C716E24|nr:nucleoporin SEH1-like [Penaeus japonicus]
MFVAKSLNAEHKDLIHDVSFDFYGRRMATCSSDQSVKIWDVGENGEWVCTSSWKTHCGPVWKVTWAHPNYGQIIATCSFDRAAAVWEETVSDSGHAIHSAWIRRTNLVDSRTSVMDVKFAPKQQGLQLATCSADGVVRIYEAPDVMNLNQWSLQYEINCKVSCSCISWNPSPSRLHSPLIAVGSDDPNPSSGGKVFIYEFSNNTRKWTRVETLVTVTEPVHDIAFAPNLGRSYHLLGIATKDVKIIALKPNRQDTTQNQSSLSTFEVRQAGQFDDHNSTVWRVSWNMTGTILASSGDDGCVRLWKANYLDIWKCISTLRGEGIVNIPEVTSAANTSQLIGGTTTGQTTARYFKLAPTTHPSHVPWH